MRRLLALFVLAALAPRITPAQESSRTATALPASAALAPAAPDPRAPLFVSVAWLAQHLRDPDLVLLHVGDAAEYPAAHLPRARLASVGDVSVGDRNGPGLAIEMPSPDSLRARLAALGISDRSRIVVYYARDMVYPSTRILLTLAYAGLGDRASLLDGGMGACIAGGQATTGEVPEAKPGTLAPLRIRNFVVDAADVQAMIGTPGVSVVDARDTAFYGGSRRGGSAQAPHRAGHIPGARNVSWSALVDDALRIRPSAAMADAFAAAGVGAKDVVIGYCHTGQQATAMLLAARALGHPILLYDGSFQDWSARTALPVEVTAPAKKPEPATATEGVESGFGFHALNRYLSFAISSRAPLSSCTPK